MELPVVGGELPVPGHQPAATDEEPTVTAARPRLLRNAPRPRAVAVAPPRHPGRRRRSRLWAAAGAGTGAAGVLVAVMLTGVLQPPVRPAPPPAKTAARLPDPASVLKARGTHPPAAHRHRHRAATGPGVTMAVAASSSPGSTQPTGTAGLAVTRRDTHAQRHRPGQHVHPRRAGQPGMDRHRHHRAGRAAADHHRGR